MTEPDRTLRPQLLLATTNQGKLHEFRALLRGWIPEREILSLAHFPALPAPEERGSSFHENARIKAEYYSREAGEYFVVAEDSGLVVPALNGEPGIRSARYAGPNASDKDNIELLLDRLKGVENRYAFFFTAAVVALNGETVFQCHGKVEGMILESGAGTKGFGYDPVFFHPGLNRTFAQISSEEKNRVSHRGEAMKGIRQFLLNMPD